LIKKAVLPVAGLGTRFLPASKAIPKEMLPIIDKPLVQYAVEEAVNVGINEIIFITSPEKFSIKNHFKKNKEIETKLVKSGKNDLAMVANPEIFSKVSFYYINQKKQNGLGDAIQHAESIIGNSPFAILLPDDLFISKKSCLQQLIDAYVLNKSSAIAVNVIDKNNIHKYGVIKPKERTSEIFKIEDIVEKPNANDAPSDLAVCGRYILNSSIFKHLKSVKPDKSDEIQLTDAIKSMLIEEEVYGVLYDGEKFDCGSKEGFVHATIALALRDESISENVKEIIRNID
jgi:UTP--glucose-1-phosphate uridylyltransferase